jgi:hypothetical protein
MNRRTGARPSPVEGVASKRRLRGREAPAAVPLELSGSAAAQPITDPTVFALGSLGWKAFQDLCGTVLGEVLGQTVTAFRPTRDGGRDFAFEGVWRPKGSEALTGSFVVQCKFKAGGAFYLSDLTQDLPKARRLVSERRCESYVLMTNGGMTAETDAAITDALRDAGVQHSLLIGGDQLDRYIRESPRLRALVPRLYGLGDLTQILDERRYQQAAALLASMRENLDKFVVTNPYGEAVQALLEHGFVLLLGAPAAGKSMIAAALAAASIDMWGSRPMRVDSADAFASAWNPLEPDQFFWIDDAFGAMQYQRQRTDGWNQQLSSIRAAISQGARFVLTSRDYIWAQATSDLKRGVFSPLETGQVVVDVHDLSIDDKRQILYNHLKYGSQPKKFRSALKPFLDQIADLEEFLPEVARRLGDPAFTGGLTPTASEVEEFFANPVVYLAEVVDGLGASEFAALTLLFMSEGFRDSPVDLTRMEESALQRLGSELSGVLRGLEALRGSLVVLTQGTEGGTAGEGWAFKHPTIGDAMRIRIGSRRELLQIYLVGSPIEGLLAEITCGDVGLQGALVVPRQYFPDVAARLAAAARSGELSRQVAEFLTSRCDDQFLREHLELVHDLEFGPTEPTAIRLANRLHSMALLPEATRASIVKHYQEVAFGHLDLSLALNPRVKALVLPGELEAFLVQLHAEVVGSLGGYLDAERENFDGSEAPEDIVGRLQETFDELARLYPGDDEVVEAIAAASSDLDDLEEHLLERAEEEPGEPDWDDSDGWRDRGSGYSRSDGGVFSDVDE